jgi:tRNA(Ile)-lysidine synthase
MIKQQVREFLKKYSLDNSQTRLLVGFSGGADSLCLLDILSNLRYSLPFDLAAIHINHQWRGEESLEDEHFAINFCQSKDINIFAERLTPGLPESESLAREKRYEMFNNVAKIHNFNALITAHTRPDQVETILYRIIKGTGYRGLAGIPEYREQTDGPAIYRPLLTTTRQDIDNYLAENNLIPRVDSSNFNNAYLRNRIRQELLPLLKDYNTGIEDALLRLSSVSKANEAALEYLLEPYYSELLDNTYVLYTRSFKQLPETLKPRILMKMLEENNVDYDYALIERLSGYIDTTELTRTGKKYSITKKVFLHVTQKNITIVRNTPANMIQSAVKLAIPGVTEFKPLNIKLKVTEYLNDNTGNIVFPPAEADRAYVDLSAIKMGLTLRTRQAGDIINPLGMQGTMKLKKYLINRQLDQQEKYFTPIVAAGNEVLWVIGTGISDKIKVKSRPTHIFEVIRGNHDCNRE